MAEKKNCPLKEAGFHNITIDHNSQIETEIKGASGFFMPLEIVSNILSRLPFKSVARFRCVCKHWRYLAYDPHFLISLRKRPSSSRFLCRYMLRAGIIFYDFTAQDGKTLEKNCSRFYPDLSWYKLSSSFNGLTCAYSSPVNDRSDIYILNPTTHESLRLPKPRGYKQRDQRRLHSEIFDLGIDDSTGEYKVVRLYCKENSWKANSYCDILTVRNEQWRYIGQIPYRIFHSAVFLNGSLHWIAEVPERDGVGYPFVIVTFDIKEEMFGSPIPIPHFSQPWRLSCLSLRKSGEELCFMIENDTEKQFEVWMLEDYASNGWVKRYSISWNILRSCQGLFDMLGVVDDHILIDVYEGDLIWSINCYDLHKKSLNKLFDRVRDGALAYHEESFISPTTLVTRKSVG